MTDAFSVLGDTRLHSDPNPSNHWTAVSTIATSALLPTALTGSTHVVGAAPSAASVAFPLAAGRNDYYAATGIEGSLPGLSAPTFSASARAASIAALHPAEWLQSHPLEGPALAHVPLGRMAFLSSSTALMTEAASSGAAGVTAANVNAPVSNDSPVRQDYSQDSTSSSTFTWPNLQPTTPPVFSGSTRQAEDTEAVQYIFQSILQRAPTSTEIATYSPEIDAHPNGSGGYNYYYAFNDVAHLQETTNKLQNAFNNDLGASASSDIISSGETYLGEGVTFSQLVSAITSSSAEAGVITATWQDVLGRAPDSGSISNDEAAINGGSSLATIRSGLAYSQEAQNDINNIFEQVLGRPVDSGSQSSDENSLATGQTLAGLRSTVATSAEAASDINNIFEQVLGRPVDSGSQSADENSLATGQTLAGLRSTVATSAEAASDINNIFEQVLGRAVDSGSQSSDENSLATGQTLTGLRSIVATSAEAASDINNIFEQVLGRAVDSGSQSSDENSLATGQTLAGLRSTVAMSAEAASDINAIYQQVLGRDSNSGDASYINSLQTAEANGSTLSASRSSIAHSSEAEADINALYQEVLGRSTGSGDAGNITALEDAMANGWTLNNCRSSIADSSEAAGIVDDVYDDWGQNTPTAQQTTDGENALYTLSLAYATEASDSQSQLASIAASYVTPSGNHWIQQDIASLASQTQADALIASGLTNSYIDAADTTASVMAVLQQGGESLLDGGVDQATGLDAVQEVQSLGTPDPCDPTTFQEQHVTTISNQNDVAVLNADTSYPGPIQWQGGNPSQQGYPYEGYVTGLLEPFGYQATIRPYTAFDQWNSSSAVAVSDKTLNTGAPSYQAETGSVGKITAKMVQYANAMLNFSMSRATGSGPAFTQSEIGSYGFFMAVPEGTTDDQWQAICEGYQMMETILSTKSVAISIDKVVA